MFCDMAVFTLTFPQIYFFCNGFYKFCKKKVIKNFNDNALQCAIKQISPFVILRHAKLCVKLSLKKKDQFIFEKMIFSSKDNNDGMPSRDHHKTIILIHALFITT